jgi:hypothetical protein
MRNDRWVRKIYKLSRKRYEEEGMVNWCSETHRLIRELRLDEEWDNENIKSMESWRHKVETAIQEREERQWRERMRKKPMLRNYVKMKTKLKFEQYLQCDGTRRDKTNMIEMRGGMNGLEINMGRREKKKREERWCRCCGEEIEDEKHFMLRCWCFRIEREEMMLDIEEICDDEDELKMRNENEDDMMDMLIGRGMEDEENEKKYEKGIETVQRYLRQSLRRRKEMMG